jgi:ascorbate-specific PTS system EIIC-type component UlaA
MGHFGSLAYYISAWVGSKVGSPDDSTENIDIPEKWGFLRDTTVSTGLTMMFFYIVAAVAAGPEYVSTLSNGMSPILFAIMSEINPSSFISNSSITISFFCDLNFCASLSVFAKIILFLI